MRIRRKPWARPELQASFLYVADPFGASGRWREIFKNDGPIWLELGCGKGGFAAGLCARFPKQNLLLVDVKSEMLAFSRRKIEQAMGDPSECRVRLAAHDIERIGMMLSPIHLCLLVSRDFFGASLLPLFRHVVPCIAAMAVFTLLVFALYQALGR